MNERTKDLLLLGSIIVSAIVLSVYMANLEATKANECKNKGGVLIKANNSRVCVKLERL